MRQLTSAVGCRWSFLLPLGSKSANIMTGIVTLCLLIHFRVDVEFAIHTVDERNVLCEATVQSGNSCTTQRYNIGLSVLVFRIP